MLITSDDFKYVMQDTMKLYLGASMSYQEVLKTDQSPFKLKAVIMQYMRKDIEETTTLAQHIVLLKEDSLSYLAFKQLKTKIKFTVIDGKTNRNGKTGNDNRVLSLDEFLKFVQTTPDYVRFFVEEVSISKLSLMGFSL